MLMALCALNEGETKVSGGGKIIERETMRLPEGDLTVVRYRVMSEYRPDWFDETERAKLFVSDEADRCRSLGQFQREKIAREALEAIVALEKRAKALERSAEA
jgi:hypothetical protein